MSPDFSITTRHIPDVHIVALHGELDIMSAYDFALALVDVAGSTVVVDLSDLTFIDSTGMSALVMARNRIRADGLGELVLTRPGGIVGKALEIVGLNSWFVDWSPDWDGESLMGKRELSEVDPGDVGMRRKTHNTLRQSPSLMTPGRAREKETQDNQQYLGGNGNSFPSSKPLPVSEFVFWVDAPDHQGGTK